MVSLRLRYGLWMINLLNSYVGRDGTSGCIDVLLSCAGKAGVLVAVCGRQEE